MTACAEGTQSRDGGGKDGTSASMKSVWGQCARLGEQLQNHYLADSGLKNSEIGGDKKGSIGNLHLAVAAIGL